MMRERERVEWNEYLERKQEGLQPKWVGEEEEKQEEAWGEASFSLFAVRKHGDGDMWSQKQTGRDSRVCVCCELLRLWKLMLIGCSVLFWISKVSTAFWFFKKHALFLLPFESSFETSLCLSVSLFSFLIFF